MRDPAPPAGAQAAFPRGPVAGLSYWQETVSEAPPVGGRLERAIRCDVAIVGGGLTGLSAAHHLAEGGQDAVVLEANEIGWGASGRNAGFAVLRYRQGFAALAQRFGNQAAAKLYRLLRDSLERVEAFVAAYDLGAWVNETGHYTPAHSQRALRALEADAQWLQREVGDATPRLLAREEMARALGSGRYVGGYFDHRARSLHPLNYVRRLAAGLADRGVSIHCNTPVIAFNETESGVTLTTPGGQVAARRLILATNAYADLALTQGRLARRVIPVSSSIVVTAPLSAEQRTTIVPSGAAVTDTKRLLNGFRVLPDGRLLCSGRGDITGRRTDRLSAYRPLLEDIAATFPSIAGIAADYCWSGMVAFPADGMPRLGCLSERVVYATGYAGRGVVLTHGLGRCAAQLAMGEEVDAGPISAPLSPIPFHRLRRPVMRAVAQYYKVRDWLDMREGQSK